MKPDQFKKAAPPIFRWLLFAFIFLSQVPAYAAAPTFTVGYPQVDTADTKHSSLELKVQTNETGKAYYVVLASGATAPSDAQVKAGQDNSGSAVNADKKGVLTLTANAEASSYIIGLTANTDYDIYVVAEDSAATLNTTPMLGSVTTAVAPIDTTPPVFDDLGNPITAGETTIEFTVKTDETGKAHYVILGNGATEPTKAQIKNGQDDANTDVDATKIGELTLTANTGAVASITGLAASTPYDIFVIAEDAEGNVATISKLDVLTLASAAAPIFNKKEAANITEDAFDLTVQTDKDSTAYYVVLDDNAVDPSAAQVKAGQDNIGTAVSKTGNVVLTANTDGTANITGLTATTNYDVFVMAEDSSGNVSTTYKLDVLTLADTTAPTFAATYPKVDGITQTTANLKVQTNEAGKAYYVLLTDGTTAPTVVKTHTNKVEFTLKADTEASDTISSLTAGTAYDIYVVAEDAAGNIATAGTFPIEFTTFASNGNNITGAYDNAGNTITPSDTITGTTTISNGTLNGTFDFSSLDVTLNNLTLAANASITGGRLEGTITGDVNNPAMLINVTIGANATLTNVIIGDGVTFEPGVTLIDVRFEGANITLADVTLKGTITIVQTSVTVFTNVQFGLNFTALSGGTLSGIIKSETGFSGSASLTSLTLKDVTEFKAVGVSVSDATFQGSFIATSTVTFTNVIFGLNFTAFSGGTLSGTVATAPGFSGSASLTSLTLKDVTDFKAVGVSVSDATFQGGFIATSTVTFTNVIFGLNFTSFSGGTLSGTVATAPGFSGSASLTSLTLKDVTDFKAVGVSVSDATFQGGFIATSTVTFTNVIFGLNFTSFSGGTLSGTIATATGFSGSASLTGLTLLNVTSFTIVGISVTNVTLQGIFTTTSTITLTNVTFGTGVTITGTGISLAGTIQPLTPNIVITLTNLNIAANSIVLQGITLGSGVIQGAGVQVITQTLNPPPSIITSTTIINNVSIPAGATITGGILGGAIIGNALNPPTLNVTSISAGAILSNVILGANITTLPLNIILGIGVQFTSLSILPIGFDLTSILPVFVPPVIVGVTLPPIISLTTSIVVGDPTLFLAITPVSTVAVFGSEAKISLKKGRLKIKLKAKPNKRPAMCGFRPSSAGSGGERRRTLRASTGNEYGFGNALYLTANGVEIKNQPSVQNLEALTAKLKEMGYSNLTVKDNGNISVEKDGKTINSRPSITSDEVDDPNTPLGFKDNKLFEKDVLTTFIFDDVDEEDGTTRRAQDLYPAPASLDDITDDSVTILTQKDSEMADSYPEDGKIKFELNGKTYEGTWDYYVEEGASTRAPGITVADNSDHYLIIYTDGTKQKLFKVPGSETDPIITPPVQQTDGGSGTTTDEEETSNLEQVNGSIDNTGILKDIALSKDTVIDGGILQGTITGSADGFAKLDNLEIVANSQVSYVTFGKNVTFGKGVTLKDVVFLGASIFDVILEGTIRTSSSGTVITNATLKANAKVIGGKLAGIIKGDSAAPALLEFLTIAANSEVTDIIIGDGVDFLADAKLGTGVKFSKADNIPFNVDLTQTLPGFIDSLAVDLSADLVVDGKGLLITINALQVFAANNFIMDQNDKSGNLQLKVGDVTFAVTPIKVKRVDDSQTPAADQSLRLGFGNTVYFKTDYGIEVESHPAPQDLATLKALLAAIEISKINITEEGNIQVPVNNTVWFSGRAALASEPAEAEEKVGFKVKGDLVVLVFEKDGQKREQVLYPAPASNALIQQAEEASLTEKGILSFKLGEKAYTGKLDYFVEKGEATESYGVTDIEDSNGDGLKDFLITYPRGDKQKLFALPPAEAATE
ncbi:beta strand repeat-containing protein [Candidatus Marithrix sp. Canyon 246]|uniref:beta strand repeat-containing protein n=1 Tax=Candidatus Marithrix sp. Canyon 246 TaxID=1827136 RepID=UPI00084A07B3|nr:hypothetical protein [Candidatus Marithrix sp. Canyon 246]